MGVKEYFRRSGDTASLEGSVACMADKPNKGFVEEAAAVVVASARTLLPESPVKQLKVKLAWQRRAEGSWLNQ